MYSGIEALNTEREFGALQRKRLGNYIYALKDPRDNKIFYVGQGIKNRVFSHMNEAQDLINGKQSYSSKRARIIDIWSGGEEVEWVILAHGLPKESLNFVESAIIDTLEVSQNGQCMNVVRGPNSSFLTSGDVEKLGAEPVPSSWKYEMVFIFPCNKADETSSESIYQSTRAAWRVNNTYLEEKAYSVGIKDGISIGAYEIERWVAHGDKKAFDGTAAPELVNYNWKKIINCSLGFWQRGNFLIVELDGDGKFRFIHGCSDKDWKCLEQG